MVLRRRSIPIAGSIIAAKVVVIWFDIYSVSLGTVVLMLLPINPRSTLFIFTTYNVFWNLVVLYYSENRLIQILSLLWHRRKWLFRLQRLMSQIHRLISFLISLVPFLNVEVVLNYATSQITVACVDLWYFLWSKSVSIISKVFIKIFIWKVFLFINNSVLSFSFWSIIISISSILITFILLF